MKVSIVTVVRNAAGTIEECLQSVASQSHVDVEHIVIDGASTDGTMDVVDRHRDQLAVVVSEPDRGIYDAMNKGIAVATGDVIGTLNADDRYADTGIYEVEEYEFGAYGRKQYDNVYKDRKYRGRGEGHYERRHYDYDDD